LDKKRLNQQEFIEQKVKEFVLENIHLVILGSDKNKK
jgi:hypothetical protein